MNVSRWAGNEDVGASDIFERLHAGLTVLAIATQRTELRTCDGREALAAVLERNSHGFDYLPVTEPVAAGEAQIVGLLDAAACLRNESRGAVQEHCCSLSEKNLIGADASILSFIQDAPTSPCRLIISGPRIVGLVGLSDLQKLPARAALFGLITGLEMTMANAIRRANAAEEWERLLSDGRRSLLEKKIDAAKSNDSYINKLLYTEFSDKVTIVCRSLKLPQSGNATERVLKRVMSLRDSLAHANEYAASPEAARDVCSIVNELLTLHSAIATASKR